MKTNLNELQCGNLLLDDGELPAEILDQFPTTPYRDPEQIRIAQQQAKAEIDSCIAAVLVFVVGHALIIGAVWMSRIVASDDNCLLITGSIANIYDASTGSEIIGYTKRNSSYEVLSESDDRYQIEDGWVIRDSVNVETTSCPD